MSRLTNRISDLLNERKIFIAPKEQIFTRREATSEVFMSEIKKIDVTLKKDKFSVSFML